MTKSAGIIIPTTGNPIVFDALQSALSQTYSNTIVYLVIDGEEFSTIQYQIREHPRLKVYSLPENTGKNGQNGHRIYSAFSFLINTDYIFYLDQDCFYDSKHVQSCVETLESKDYDWVYSLRKIVNNKGKYICNDDCESLGPYNPLFDYNLVDTNCYALKTEIARLVAPHFIGTWGHDRRLLSILLEHFKNFTGTGEYTVNYRMGGSDNKVNEQFFVHCNELVRQKYNSNYPWRKA